MAQLPQGDIRSFLLGQADVPSKQVLVFRGAQVVCSNCQNHFSKQGIQSHEKACGVKPKAVPHGRVQTTGPLYPAGEARLAAEAEEGRISMENSKRFKAWAEDTSDSAYDITKNLF
jgi:hypothetical protein